MGISVNTSKQQVTAAVTDDKVTATVSSGFGSTGPQGGSGVVAVSAPITNSGTNTSANIGLSVGAGLQVASGNLAVTYGSSGVSSCVGNDARLSDSREWSASTVNRSEAEGGTAEIRRAWTAQRVFQAIASWWSTSAAKTKLDGIATGATANATDAQLRDRATHTGTQASSTISDFASAVVAAAPPTTDASLLTEGTLDSARLPASGVDPGTYSTVTVDATGRVTEGATHSVSWDDVGSKPEEFPPIAHQHVSGDLDSESATAGYVLTADGDGGASWGAPETFNFSQVVPSEDYTATTYRAASGASVTVGYSIVPPYSDARSAFVSLSSGGIACETGPDSGGNPGYSLAITSAGITFPDDTTQTTAWLGTFSYNDLTDLPTLGTAAAADSDDFAAASHAHAWSDITSGVPGTFTPSAHNHTWSEITSGVPTSLAGYGITDAVASNDSRLTDARTPTSHKSSHATGGSDALSASDIGAAASSHTHAASDIASGTISTARLGSGTASSSTFLRGDNTWATAGSTSASDLTSGTLANARLPSANRLSAYCSGILFG